MRIYLGCLGHYTVKLSTNHVPINIGFIAAYLKKNFGDSVEITLFKNPHLLIDAIDKNPPHVLGLSNYVWCQSVSEEVFKYYKKMRPDGVTLWGGPNFPINEPHKAAIYLRERPYVDFYVPYEGEIPTLLIVKNLLESGKNYRELQKERPEIFEGAFFISSAGELVGKNIGVQLKDINEVPSPYLTGFMDPFLREGLNPMIETQRGCPYHCTYCYTGQDYYNRGRSFSLDRSKEEILYITKVAPDPTKVSLFIIDSNFGMWPQDLEFAKWLRTHYENTGFPLSLVTSTGKGRLELVLETVKAHPKLMLNNAVQSMDDKVLKEIRRTNLSIMQLSESQREMDQEGKISHPEVILGLPLETRESHLNTLRLLVNEIGASLMWQYTLILLPGTPLYTDAAREKYKYNVRYRVLPTAFGEYGGTKVFEIEEVSVGHKDMSYAEYLEMREVFFYIHNINGNAIYRTLVQYIQYRGGDVIGFFLYLMGQRKQLAEDDFPNRVVCDYLRDTEEELFYSREELVRFFLNEKNYEELKTGERGKNLTHTYKALVLLHTQEWAEYVTRGFVAYIEQNHGRDNVMRGEIDSVVKHVKAQAECQYRYFSKPDEIPTEHSPLVEESDHDIPEFFTQKVKPRSEQHILPQKTKYVYFMRDDAIKYITSLPKKQRLVDWALIILRMDKAYFLPIFRRKAA